MRVVPVSIWQWRLHVHCPLPPTRLNHTSCLYRGLQCHIPTAVGNSTPMCLKLLNLVKISGKLPLVQTYVYFYPFAEGFFPHSFKLTCFWANKMYHGSIPLLCACVCHWEKGETAIWKVSLSLVLPGHFNESFCVRLKLVISFRSHFERKGYETEAGSKWC